MTDSHPLRYTPMPYSMLLYEHSEAHSYCNVSNNCCIESKQKCFYCWQRVVMCQIAFEYVSLLSLKHHRLSLSVKIFLHQYI